VWLLDSILSTESTIAPIGVIGVVLALDVVVGLVVVGMVIVGMVAVVVAKGMVLVTAIGAVIVLIATGVVVAVGDAVVVAWLEVAKDSMNLSIKT
jgi:energy-converting hydrogenase Eha subunit C